MKIHMIIKMNIVASLFLLSGTTALAGDSVTVYGKLRAFLENTTGDAVHDDVYEVHSRSSRVGVKGKLNVHDDMKALYKLEWQVDITDDNSNSGKAGEDDPKHLKSRNQFIGLEGRWGKFIIGRNDSPLKRLKKKIALFDDTVGDSSNMMVGKTRSNDIVEYSFLNVIEGLDFSIMGSPGEEQDATGCVPCDDARHGVADSLSASLTFTSDNLFVGLATDNELKSGSSGLLGKKEIDAARLVVQYKADEFTFAVQHQIAEDATQGVILPDEEQAQMISAQMKLENYIIKLQHGVTELEDGATEKVIMEKKQWAFGVERKLSDKIKVITLVNKFTDDDGLVSLDDKTVAAGMQLLF